MTIDPRSLEPGEQLLWYGKPDVEAYSERKGLTNKGFVLGLAALIAGLLLGLYGSATRFEGAGPQLFVVLTSIGAIVMYIPLRLRWKVRRIRYGVTDRRAIIENPGWLLRNRISLPFSQIRRIEVCEFPRRKFGDVIFWDYVIPNADDGPIASRGGFFAIENAGEVERLLHHGAATAGGKYSERFANDAS
jgi:hypothetical protein